MKKLSYIIVLAAAVFAAATSCQKDELVYQNDNQQIQGKGLVFYATLENGDTKTTIESDGYKICWEASDSISVNGTIYKAVPDEKHPVMATFIKMRETDPDPVAPFKGYYPASIYDSTANVATLPATQAYKAEGNIAGILPMYAESEDTNLNFKNICGLMKFNLKGTQKLKSITFKDDTKALSGIFTVSGNAAVLDPAAEGGVTLDCGDEGVQLDGSTAKTFYVAVPAGSYDGLHIEYSIVDHENVQMTASATASVERNKVYGWDDRLIRYTADDFCGAYSLILGSNQAGVYYKDTVVIEKFQKDTLYISGLGANNPGWGTAQFTPAKFKAVFDGILGTLTFLPSISVGTLSGTSKNGPYQYDIRLSGGDWGAYVTNTTFTMKTKGTLTYTNKKTYFYCICYTEDEALGYSDVLFPKTFMILPPKD